MSADTLILAFWSAGVVTVFLLLLLVPAFAVEWWQARAMRRRQREREALRRYCDSIIGNSWRGPAQ